MATPRKIRRVVAIAVATICSAACSSGEDGGSGASGGKAGTGGGAATGGAAGSGLGGSGATSGGSGGDSGAGGNAGGAGGATTMPLLAFPDAVGFGKNTVGGRGGKPFFVDTLGGGTEYVDHGTYWTGTFKAGLAEVAGPRVIIPRVSGTIQYAYNDYITVNNPNITIAMHAAPGEGLLIKGGVIIVATGEVIIRHLRHMARVESDGLPPHTESVLLSVWQGANSADIRNVVIDHSSFGWWSDDALGAMMNVGDITFSYNLLAEPVLAEFPAGALGAGTYGSSLPNGGYTTMYRNFMASGGKRAPITGNGVHADIVNNVVQSFYLKTIFQCAYARADWNWVNNYYVDAPGWWEGKPEWEISRAGTFYRNTAFLGASNLYAAGNYNPAWPGYTQDQLIQRVAVGDPKDKGDPKFETSRMSWGEVYPGETDAVVAAEVTSLTTGAGAYLTTDSSGKFITWRNHWETGVLNRFKTNTPRRLPKDPLTDFPGEHYPDPAPGAKPYPDSDHDGVPDGYTLPADKTGADLRVDGYSYLEGFLYQMARYWDK